MRKRQLEATVEKLKTGFRVDFQYFSKVTIHFKEYDTEIKRPSKH